MMCPEIRLLYGILERAVLDILGSYSVERRDAFDWMMKPLNIETPELHSFCWVCMHLDLCPETLRNKVLLAYNQDSHQSKGIGKGLTGLLEAIYDPAYGEEIGLHTGGLKRSA